MDRDNTVRDLILVRATWYGSLWYAFYAKTSGLVQAD